MHGLTQGLGPWTVRPYGYNLGVPGLVRARMCEMFDRFSLWLMEEPMIRQELKTLQAVDGDGMRK